ANMPDHEEQKHMQDLAARQEPLLTREINAELDRLAAAGEPWAAPWIAHEVYQRHEVGLQQDSEDAEFWRYTVHAYVGRRVREEIARRRGEPVAAADVDPPLTAEQHRAQAAAHFQHADELERFIQERQRKHVELGCPLRSGHGGACREPGVS